MLESSPLATELHQHEMLLLITRSAPNINKFKNLLDRDLNLLVKKSDCDSYFFKRKTEACSCRPYQTESSDGRKNAAEAYASPYSVAASTRHLCSNVHNQKH